MSTAVWQRLSRALKNIAADPDIINRWTKQQVGKKVVKWKPGQLSKAQRTAQLRKAFTAVRQLLVQLARTATANPDAYIAECLANAQVVRQLTNMGGLITSPNLDVELDAEGYVSNSVETRWKVSTNIVTPLPFAVFDPKVARAAVAKLWKFVPQEEYDALDRKNPAALWDVAAVREHLLRIPFGSDVLDLKKMDGDAFGCLVSDDKSPHVSWTKVATRAVFPLELVTDALLDYLWDIITVLIEHSPIRQHGRTFRAMELETDLELDAADADLIYSPLYVLRKERGAKLFWRQIARRAMIGAHLRAVLVSFYERMRTLFNNDQSTFYVPQSEIFLQGFVGKALSVPPEFAGRQVLDKWDQVLEFYESSTTTAPSTSVAQMAQYKSFINATAQKIVELEDAFFDVIARSYQHLIEVVSKFDPAKLAMRRIMLDRLGQENENLAAMMLQQRDVPKEQESFYLTFPIFPVDDVGAEMGDVRGVGKLKVRLYADKEAGTGDDAARILARKLYTNNLKNTAVETRGGEEVEMKGEAALATVMSKNTRLPKPWKPLAERNAVMDDVDHRLAEEMVTTGRALTLEELFPKEMENIVPQYDDQVPDDDLEGPEDPNVSGSDEDSDT
jgi:hypothetical protein